MHAVLLKNLCFSKPTGNMLTPLFLSHVSIYSAATYIVHGLVGLLGL